MFYLWETLRRSSVCQLKKSHQTEQLAFVEQSGGSVKTKENKQKKRKRMERNDDKKKIFPVFT